MSEYQVYITDNKTGETRVYTDPYLAPDKRTGKFYIWEDGNYSCDCNRALFFQWAVNKSEYDIDVSCGHTRYSIEIKEDGETVYSE